MQIVSLFAVVGEEEEEEEKRYAIFYYRCSCVINIRDKRREIDALFLCAQRNVFLSSTATMKTQIVTPRIVKLVATTSPQLRARTKRKKERETEREREGSLRKLLLS